MPIQEIILSKINKTLKRNYIYLELSLDTYIIDPIVKTGRKNFYIFCNIEKIDKVLENSNHYRVDLNTMIIHDKKGKKIDYIFPLVFPLDEKYNLKMSTIRKKLSKTYIREIL